LSERNIDFILFCW